MFVPVKLIKGDGNSSIEDISDISGEMDHLNPLATSHYRPKRRRSTAITERFGVFLSPWGKIIRPCKLYPVTVSHVYAVKLFSL